MEKNITLKQRLFAFVLCMFAFLSAGAVSVTYSDGIATLNFDQDTNVSLWDNSGNPNNWDLINRIDGNFTKMVVLGSNVSATDIENIFKLNKFNQSSANQTLDLSDAKGFTIDQLSQVQLKASKVILPKGTSLPDESVYNNSGSKWNQGNLRYVCVLGDDGTVSVGGGNFNNRNGENAIKNDVENSVYPFSEASKIVLSGGAYTNDDETAVKDFNASHASTTYENGVLTLASGDDTDQTLPGKVTELGASGADKVVFPDGSVWERSTGKLTATGNAEAHEAALKAAGFEVSSVSTVQTIGQYVKIVDGVTVVTNPYNANNYDSWNPKPTAEEKEAIRTATSLKLVGTIGSEAFSVIGSNSTPSSVDLTEAIISQGTVSYTYYYWDTENTKRFVLSQDSNGWYYTDNGVRKNVEEGDVRIYTASVSGGQKMPDGWKNSLTEISLPTDANYNVIGASFCNGFTNLTTVNIPDNITVIGNEAFRDNSKLTDVTIPEGVVAICYQAFYKTSLAEIVIPGSVEIVEKQAFTECEKVTKLVFAESDADHHMIVKYYGFFNLEKLRDIYINTSANIDCENSAFDYRVTWGQGDTTRDLCTLHFSADVASHYANLNHPLTAEIAKDPAKFHNWLHAHYSYASNPGANGWWEFVSNGTIGSDDVKGDPTTGKFLRTYSDYNYDRIVPEGTKAYIVTGLKESTKYSGCFEVDLLSVLVIPKRTGVILYGEANSTDQDGNPILSMSLCEIANGKPLRRDYWYTLIGNDGQYLKNYLWPTCVALDSDPENYVSEAYLEYDLDAEGNVTTDSQGNYNVEVKSRMVLKEAEEASSVSPWDNQKDYATPDGAMEGYDATTLNGFFRNFYMSRYKSTNSGKSYMKQNNGTLESNFVGFFRAKQSTIKPGMAYLRLKSDEYTDAEGGEVIINGDTQACEGQNMKNYQVEYKKGTGEVVTPSTSGYWYDYIVYKDDKNERPNMNWTDESNWGDRTLIADKADGLGAKFVTVKFSGEPLIEEYTDGTAKLIIQAEETGDFYNLQGVKVANPSKGVYIKNGKKVVIK